MIRNGKAKIIPGFFLRIVIAILLGALLLTAVYLLPTAPIEKNVVQSAKIIQQEGTYPSLYPWCTSALDNFTDSIMLMHSAYPGFYSPWVEAMKVHRFYVEYELPDEELVDLYLNGKEYSFIDSYSRYWHGYLIFLKPLLSITDLDGIRGINAFVQIALVCLLLYELWKSYQKHFIIPFLLVYLCLMPTALFHSLQFSSCFYISVIGSIIAIEMQRHQADEISFYILFLYIGIALAFFDFLTYPILTFGIPYIFYINMHDVSTVKESFRGFCKLFASWVVGYGGMWLGKLIIGTILTGENLFSRASDKVSYWLFSEKSFSLFEMFYGNVRDFAYTPFIIFLVLYVITFAVLALRRHKNIISVTSLQIIFPYVLVGILPFLWYCFLLKPSGIHHFFTCKALAVTAFSGACLVTSLNSSKFSFPSSTAIT